MIVIVPLLIALSLLLTGQTIASAEQYVCVGEKATGFVFDGRVKDWKATTFRTDAKYLIAPGKPYAFQVTKIGESSPTAYCPSGFNEHGYLFCDGVTGTFRFNNKNGRFLNAYLIGYVSVVPGVNKSTDESSDTPSLEIGKCSPM